MWFMISLLFVLIAVGLIEHAQWQARESAALCVKNTELALEMMTSLAENMYAATSLFGVPYSNETRAVVANHVSLARTLLSTRKGPPVIADHTHLPGKTWPYNSDGKIEL